MKGEEGDDERNGAAHGCRCIEPVARRSRGEQKGQPGSLFSQLNEDAKSGRRRGGERDRFCPPPTSLSLSLSFSPPLIRVRFFRWQSLENRDSLFLSPPLSLSLSLRFHAFPAGSELLFAREPRCRPLCLASVCILIVGPPLSFVPRVARREEGEERERERERDAWSTRERSLSKQRFNDRGSFHGRAFFRGNEFHRRVSSS